MTQQPRKRRAAAPRKKKFTLVDDDGTFMPDCVEVAKVAGQYSLFDTEPQRVMCSSCMGNGFVFMQSEYPVTCPKCKGVGRIVAVQPQIPNPVSR